MTDKKNDERTTRIEKLRDLVTDPSADPDERQSALVELVQLELEESGKVEEGTIVLNLSGSVDADA